MNITVYCGSRSGSDPAFEAGARALGKWIGTHGHTLVYGGSAGGLMGALADEALAAGGKVIGVEPDVPMIRARQHPGLTECVYTDSMSERRTEMIRRGELFIALPGGLGTLDEITEVLDLRSLKLREAPVVFFNVNGYYEPMKAVFENIVKNGFGDSEYFGKILFTDDPEQIGRLI